MHLARPGTAFSTELGAGTPGTLDPLSGARVGIARLIGHRSEGVVAKTFVHYLQLFARSAGDVASLETFGNYLMLHYLCLESI